MTSERRTFVLSISNSQFYLEPEQPSRAEYWRDRRETDQEFSSFPFQAAIGTPSETYKCEVTVEFRSEAPDLEDAAQAVCCPITVGKQVRLFLRTVPGGEEEVQNYFDIAPGKYDVLLRFFPLDADKEFAEVGLRAWRVEASVLPDGSMKPGAYRREYGEAPSEAIVNF